LEPEERAYLLGKLAIKAVAGNIPASSAAEWSDILPQSGFAPPFALAA